MAASPPTLAHIDLSAFLSGHVFGFVLLLSRIGPVMMLMPGIGDTYVPPNIRLTFALILCALLLGPLMPLLPALPPAPGDIARLIVHEAAIGFFFGTLLRLIMSALDAAGSIIGLETGLSNATLLNPAQATQSSLPSAFLSVAGLAMIFCTGLDRLLIQATVALYNAFPPTAPLMPGDMAQAVINIANRSFVVGVEFAAPFLIMGLLIYAGFGVLQRLMPQVQIFMVLMPLEIWGGLMLFSLTVAGILTLWMQFFNQTLDSFFH